MKWASLYKQWFHWKIKFYKNILSDNKPQAYPRLKQAALFLGKGVICISSDAQIGYFPSPLFYSTYAHIEARNESSHIEIGGDTFINNNACIISNGANIHIGSHCRIGCNFNCVDSDFHGKRIEDRDNASAISNKDVYIGDYVFIGNNVTILKGCVIGEGCILGACSVVTHSFPPCSIIAGNPAIQIGDVTV